MCPLDGKAYWASYDFYGHHRIHIMHLAASLGSIPVMEELVAYCGRDLLNVRSLYRRLHCNSVYENHSSPLLSAIYMSQRSAAAWLIASKADVTVKNVDGLTPLHMVAYNGFQYEGEYKQGMSLAKVTNSLVQMSASLDAQTGALEHRSDSQAQIIRRKTPLQLAADNHSIYPTNMLHLLTKSVQLPENSEPLNEVCIIAQTHPMAAERLMDEICKSKKIKMRLLFEVQREGGSAMRKLVATFKASPVVGAQILGVLTFTPFVNDRQKNPLPAFALLRNNALLTCYQPDVTTVHKPDVATVHREVRAPAAGRGREEEETLTLPVWDASRPPWQSQLTTLPKDPLLHHSVYEVDVEVVHFPGLMDLQLINVLALLWGTQKHTELFSQIPIRAVVTSLWQRCVRSACNFDLAWLMGVLVLEVLLGVSLPPEDWRLTHDAISSYIGATVLRECFHTIYEAVIYTSETGIPPCFFLRKFHAWRLVAVVGLFLQMLFAYRAGGYPNFKKGRGKNLLTINLFLRFAQFILDLRVRRGIGEKILAVTHSFTSMSNMLVLMLLVFGTFYCVFLTLRESSMSYLYVFLYLFQALVNGEGDGLEAISGFGDDFTGDDDWCVYELSIFFMVLGTILSVVVMISLVIAMYSSIYEQMVPWALHIFHKTRAKVSIRFMLRLRLQLTLIQTYSYKKCQLCNAIVTATSLLCWILLITASYEQLGFVPLAIAVQFIESMLLADKFHENTANHYLWVCHRKDYVPTRSLEEEAKDVSDLRSRIKELESTVRTISSRDPSLSSQMKDRRGHSRLHASATDITYL